MNIKLGVGEIELLVDKRVPMAALARQLAPVAAKASVVMPEPRSGAGYIQWELPGSGWQKANMIDSADRGLQARVTDALSRGREAIKVALKGAPVASAVLTIPSNDFIYFRITSDNSIEIALPGWGYRYPDSAGGGELGYDITHIELQSVAIGFRWADRDLTAIPFTISGRGHVTSSADGLFRVDGKLPVGSSYDIEASGHRFNLIVESGREEYIFDLAEHAVVIVEVVCEGKPFPGKIDLTYDGVTTRLCADSSGRARTEIELKGNAAGVFAVNQPEVEARIGLCHASAVPKAPGEVITLRLDVSPLVDPGPPDDSEQSVDPDPPVDPEPTVRFRLLDYGGFPLPDLDFTVTNRAGQSATYHTDSQGYAEVKKSFFSKKEKIRVDFTVSADYQRSHDLHDPRNPRSDNPKKK